MLKKFNHPKLTVLGCMLLLLIIITGTVSAEIKLGGKIETNLLSTISVDGQWMTAWQEHLNLKFILPRMGATSAKFEFDIYYQPQTGSGLPTILGDVKKLYVKHKFDKFHLTLGRQPISWSFGSLINPVDYRSGGMMLMNLVVPEKSENALLGYIPLNRSSNLTLIAAFPEGTDETKWALRGRSDLFGYDLTLNYVREPETLDGLLPLRQHIGTTFKGDLGDFGVYGAVGYFFQENFQAGNPTYLIGADYSFDLENGSKIILQLEYLRDEANQIQFEPLKPDLFLGLIGYEIDEFASIGLSTMVNQDDQSLVLIPTYKNLIGSNLDFTMSGVLFLGEIGSQFGPNNLIPELTIPNALVQIGFSYPF